ncbi:MAG: hypothetical protein LQ350_008631, partial [Teloschistes chrysophthalmus]
VVVPLIALRQDLHRRCEEVGIHCREWNRRSPPDDARIVLVTPESARSDDFIRFMNRIRGQERLDRIVIDECHVVLNEQHDFRPRLRELGELNRAQVPMVMLTATLPPTDEDEFLKRMWLRRGDLRIFRATTTRKNIQYRTYRLRGRTSEQQESDLLRTIREAQGQLSGSEKLVIYSSRVEDCKALAASVDGEAYFHDAEDKKGIFHRFATEDGCSTMVATSAFGMGVDVPHIRWVIHTNEPLALFDYSQESGRAGRDGLPSQALIIRGRMKGGRQNPSQMDIHGQLMEIYLDARCKRMVLDHYLDGRDDRSCCEAGEEACEGCRRAEEMGEDDQRLVEEEEPAARSSTPPPTEAPMVGFDSPRAERVVPMVTGGGILARHQVMVRESQEQIGQLRDLVLDRVRGRCAYCYLTRQANGSEHYMFRCRVPECAPIREASKGWKVRLRGRKELQGYAGCHYCFLPQAWCNRWRERTGAGNAGMYDWMPEEKVCQYQDVVVESLAVLIHLEAGFQEQMQGRMPAGMEWADVTQYWGRRTRWAGVDMYQMIVELWEGFAIVLEDQQEG